MFDQIGAGIEALTPKSERKITWLWVATIAILSICAIMSLWFPVLRIGSLPSLNYNEGWNVYRQRMTIEGQPLYGQQPRLWITNYPFLSFHLVGMLGAAIGNMVLAGRIVSLASLIIIAALVGGIVRIAGGSTRGGIYAGLCLLLWIATFTPDRRAMDDPELLGEAIATLGLLAYIKAPKTALWLSLSALAFAAGMFTKQDTIALPLSVGVHILVTRNWRALALWCAVGIVAASLLLILTYSLDGPYLFAALLWPRAYSVPQLIIHGIIYLFYFGAPVAICITLLLRCGGIPYRGLLLILLIVTNIISLYFAGGDGTGLNIFYPPLIAFAVTCGIIICFLERARTKTTKAHLAFIAALIVPAFASAQHVPHRIIMDLAIQRNLPATTAAAQRTSALLRSVDGPAFCEDILLCYGAGKPLDYDPYFVNDQISIGRLKESDVLAMLISHHYAVIEIGTVDTPIATKSFRFTKAFMQTLLAEYKPVLTDGMYTVFEPRGAAVADIR